jgi:hypothetical protein
MNTAAHSRTEQPVSSAALLDRQRLDAITTSEFRDAHPYPWLNPTGVLSDAAFDVLARNMPPLEIMKPSFGRKRAHGQQPHDRYALEYRPDLPVHPAWHQLVSELEGPVYQQWLARLFATNAFSLTYHWHFTPPGCSVSPHCDAKRKIGSHIFYFNTPQGWERSWGGETLILDDEGKFSRRSAPPFEAFTRSWTAEAIGNRSLLFQRRGNSWHGVKSVACPDGMMRKVFIVVVNADTFAGRLRRLFYRPEGY